MIPGAEKNVRWSIPDDAIKPQCTLNEMIHYLILIQDISEGREVTLFSKNDKSKSIQIYEYMSSVGFITRLPRKFDIKDLKKAKVASQGQIVLENYNRERLAEERTEHTVAVDSKVFSAKKTRTRTVG